MKRLLRLYPSAWRERYEAEVSDLLAELPADRTVAIDLFRGALVEQARAQWRRIPESVPAGGPSMLTHPLQRHPTTLAVVAILLVAPTSIFIFLSLLAYEIGVPGLATVVEPALEALTVSRLVDLFLVMSPFVAFLVALAPLVGIGLSRAEGELRVTFAFRARALNLLVLALCVIVGGLLAGHIVTEFLLEPPR